MKPILTMLQASKRQWLNFFEEDGAFTVQVSNKPDSNAACQVYVTADGRPRLTEVHLRQLDAEIGDTLVFKPIADGLASIEVLKSGVAKGEPPGPFALPDEVEEQQTYIEGAVKQVTLNAYERDPEARRECLSYYGTDCYVCNFSFEQYYGEIGAGYIHVHHLRPLSQIRGEYELDPVKDLRPVCPNCHAMLHRGQNPPRSIERLKEIIAARRRLSEARPRAVRNMLTKR